MTLPSVSIVIVNLNGRHHFEALFNSLGQLDYPAALRQIVIVDNASRDGSVEWLSQHARDVRLVQCTTNLGFAAGINAGVAASSGDVLVFLNTDMRVEPAWLQALVEPLARGEADCTTSLTLSWDGRRVNFGGAAMNFHGIGWQVGQEDERIDRYRRRSDALFACGGSMAIRRAVYDDAGGFDDDFFAYYEDVDLGLRLWVLGYRVLYVPEAVAYHHHKATSRRIDIQKIRVLQMRNPLWVIYKNYEEATLARALPAAMLVQQKRTAGVMRLSDRGYRIDAEDGHRRGWFHENWLKVQALRRSEHISPLATADFVALDDFASMLGTMQHKRRDIQGRRRRTDADIVRLFRIPFWSVQADPGFVNHFTGVVTSFDLFEIFGTREIVLDPSVAIDR